MKRNLWWQKLLLLAVYGAVVGIFWYFQIPCIWKMTVGIPCPGCGMSHALLAALRLQFAEAFRWHPMVWSLPLLLGYYITDGHLFPNRKINRFMILLIGIGFLIHWIYGLFW